MVTIPEITSTHGVCAASGGIFECNVTRARMTRARARRVAMNEWKLRRREWLQMAGAAAIASLMPRSALAVSRQSCAPPIPDGVPANGGPCPYPIPWLDKNGNHNQSPKANVELSNIFHFKGKLARCNGFTGMGTDNKGTRLAWGTPTTDYSYMAGEYWAARRTQSGVFSHI